MKKPTLSQELTAFELVLFTLTLFVLGLLAVDLLLDLPEEIARVVRWVDNVACGLFFIDFVIRFRRAESKLAYMKWGWLDLLAAVPAVDSLRWARLFRVFRILRVLRAVKSLRLVLRVLFRQRAAGGLASIFAITFLVLSLSSAGILLAERSPDSNIRDAYDAVWWSVTTVTTVGYGDRYPVTTEGRFIAAALMFTGVGLFGTLSGAIASFFLGDKKDPEAPEPAADTAALLVRISSLEAELEQLRRPPPPGPGTDEAGAGKREGP